MRYTENRGGGIPARMSPGLSLIFGPIIGLAYAISFPFIGLAMITVLTLRRVGEGLVSLVRTITAFGWRPMESYLSGRKKTKK